MANSQDVVVALPPVEAGKHNVAPTSVASTSQGTPVVFQVLSNLHCSLKELRVPRTLFFDELCLWMSQLYGPNRCNQYVVRDVRAVPVRSYWTKK
jgi:hypothetical protein